MAALTDPFMTRNHLFFDTLTPRWLQLLMHHFHKPLSPIEVIIISRPVTNNKPVSRLRGPSALPILATDATIKLDFMFLTEAMASL